MKTKLSDYLIYIMLVAGFIGYILNLAKLFAAQESTDIIVRVIGFALPPIGAVLGYL